MPFQSESYEKRSVTLRPSAAAFALNASRSDFSFALLVPFTAGGLASSTNQLVAVSLAVPPMRPAAEGPSPATAGATARPATHRSASTSRRLVFSIFPFRIGHLDVSAPPPGEPPETPSRIVGSS